MPEPHRFGNKLILPPSVTRGPGAPLDGGTTPGGSAPTYAPDRTWAGIAGSTGFESIRDEMWQDMLNDGAPLKIVRVGLNWSAFENTQGVYNYNSIDSIIHAAVDMGLEVLLNFNYAAPCWTEATGPDAQMMLPGAVSWSTFKAKYNLAVKAIVNRWHKYGNNKASWVSSTKNVKFYEIWNEQNNTNFWQDTDNANGFGIGYPDPFRFADLMAGAYDTMKQAVLDGGGVGSDIIVMNGGFAVGAMSKLSGRGTPDFFETNWLPLLYEGWSDISYTKHTGGWADVPLDALVLHPYVSSRDENLNGPFKAAGQVTGNATTNTMCNKIPACWNICNNHGHGSLKVWGTEHGAAWRLDAVTGYGHNWGHQTIKDERKIYSGTEAYTYERTAWRVWRGLDAWPTGSNLTRFADQGGAGWKMGDTVSGSVVDHLGPLFYFGLRDHQTDAYDFPATIEENYGIYKKKAPWTGTGSWEDKRGPNSNDDAMDAFMNWS